MNHYLFIRTFENMVLRVNLISSRVNLISSYEKIEPKVSYRTFIDYHFPLNEKQLEFWKNKDIYKMGFSYRLNSLNQI